MLLAQERRDCCRDLLAALNRRLDRVGEVRILAAQHPQVEEREAPRGRLARHDIVVDRQGRRSQASADRIGIARIVDGADGRREPKRQHGVQHRAVLRSEAILRGGEPIEHLRQ
nr:hypothetical protein [Methylobacterium frigidaeris]